MPIKRCPLGSPECALFIVAQLLLRLLGGKSSVATKTHSGEQKSNSKDQQTLDLSCYLKGLCNRSLSINRCRQFGPSNNVLIFW
ncbi:hypothetical protein FX995_06420 [Pseudoalteromonas flavipulchra]|nr:hypothetical protein [Pseudoalteromonas flavipulchra]RZG16034.1 hypothetical protein EXT47_08075 [Pseudoalteromonas sp. CO342X]